LYRNCRLCPRNCGVDRLAGAAGFCGETAELRLAFAGLHSGEEPPISGAGGSGAIFVSGCNLGCAFCQNYQISQGDARGIAQGGAGPDGTGSRRMGRAVSAETFAAICLELQRRGAENINIVTGAHAVPAIVLGLEAARSAGLSIPVLWNSSGYESPQTLDLLADHVDMYLPDLKTLDRDLAARFFNAPDYPRAAAAAILKMIELTRGPSRTGTAARTVPAVRVIIRHLVLPGCLDSTREALRWFAGNARGSALLSLMTQYTPVNHSPRSNAPVPARVLDEREYGAVVGWLEEFGIEDGFCQEPVTSPSPQSGGWLPDFDKPNPFSSKLSVPVWHWRQSSDIVEEQQGDGTW
jgi:putative pyruvate formate lyase activating enzyme